MKNCVETENNEIISTLNNKGVRKEAKVIFGRSSAVEDIKI